MQKKNHCKGFTLIELIVVCTIIGILASIAVPKYRRAVDRARAGEALTLLRSIYDSCERYGYEHPYVDGNITKTDCGSAVAHKGATFRNLDIIVKGSFSADGKTLTTDNFSYTLTGSTTTPVFATAVKGIYADSQITLSNNGVFSCSAAHPNDQEAQRACTEWGANTWNQN